MRVLDLATGQVKHVLEGLSSGLNMVFSSDGSKLASVSGGVLLPDQTVQVWDLRTGQVEHTLEGHSGGVNTIVFQHNGSKPDSCQPETIPHRVESRLFYSVDWILGNSEWLKNLDSSSGSSASTLYC